MLWGHCRGRRLSWCRGRRLSWPWFYCTPVCLLFWSSRGTHTSTPTSRSLTVFTNLPCSSSKSSAKGTSLGTTPPGTIEGRLPGSPKGAAPQQTSPPCGAQPCTLQLNLDFCPNSGETPSSFTSSLVFCHDPRGSNCFFHLVFLCSLQSSLMP